MLKNILSKFKINYLVIFCLSFLFGNFALASSGNNSAGAWILVIGFLVLISPALGIFLYFLAKYLSKFSDEKRSRVVMRFFNHPFVFLIFIILLPILAEICLRSIYDFLDTPMERRGHIFVLFQFFMLVFSMLLVFYGALSRYLNRLLEGYVLVMVGIVFLFGSINYSFGIMLYTRIVLVFEAILDLIN